MFLFESSLVKNSTTTKNRQLKMTKINNNYYVIERAITNYFNKTTT